MLNWRKFLPTGDQLIETDRFVPSEGLNTSVRPEQILAMGNRAQVHLSSIRDELLKPHPRKTPPILKSSHIASLLGIERKRIDYLVAQKDSKYPQGHKNDTRIRYFSVQDAMEFFRLVRNPPTRPEGSPGAVVTFGIFKGGVAKTTTAVSMAQALTLRGLNVLLIDLDPQGSATQIMGYAPDAEIEINDTAAPIFCMHDDPEYRPSLLPSIAETYWPNLDLIAANSRLFGAEYDITINIKKVPGFKFWNVLNTALDEVRQIYDVVIIDTPPSLSYTTLNALFASNGIIAPVPPSALDFASSTQFWAMLGEVLAGMDDEKTFDFVNIVLTKVRTGHPVTAILTQWISDAYSGYVLPIQIPDSRAIDNATTAFNTIYDITTPDGTMESYLKVKEPMDQLATYLYQQVTKGWK